MSEKADWTAVRAAALPIEVSPPPDAAGGWFDGHTRRSLVRLVLSAIFAVGITLGVATSQAAPASAHVPRQPNQCSWVPDGVWPVFDFSHACGHHDLCYRGHLGTREYCDNAFYGEMGLHCEQRHSWWNPRRWDCLAVAATYYRGVRAFGATPYALHSDTRIA